MTSAQALTALDNLTSLEATIIRWSTENGNPKGSYYVGEHKISVTYSGDEWLNYTIDGREPIEGEPGPISKKDMRFLINNATFAPDDERGVSSGRFHPGTKIPVGESELLAGCAQDGNWTITSGRVAYNRQTGVFESVEYEIHNPDFTIQVTKPDGSQREENPVCRVVWDFTATNGQVINKPAPN